MSPSTKKPFRAAVFAEREQAENAVKGLLDAGFDRDRISVLCSDEAKERHFREFEHEDPAGEHAAESAAAGSVAGAVLGGLTTAGVATAAGVSVLAAGPSFLIGGAVAGGLIGLMTSRGEERELADFYDQAVTAGRLLVAVEDHGENAEQRLAQAEQILADAGAEPFELREG